MTNFITGSEVTTDRIYKNKPVVVAVLEFINFIVPQGRIFSNITTLDAIEVIDVMTVANNTNVQSNLSIQPSPTTKITNGKIELKCDLNPSGSFFREGDSINIRFQISYIKNGS